MAGGTCGLADHSMLALLRRKHEGILRAALQQQHEHHYSCECFLLLPEEGQLRGAVLDEAFLESHVVLSTPYQNKLITLRGEEIERHANQLVASLGFRTRVCSSILQEERIYDLGNVFTCLLLSCPIVPITSKGPTAPKCLDAESLRPSTRQRSTADALQDASQQQAETKTLDQCGLPGAREVSIDEWGLEEVQEEAERWWSQGPAWMTAQRKVITEILRFKEKFVLVPGFESALGQRLSLLVSKCVSFLPKHGNLEAIMDRFVWLHLRERLWDFFVSTAEAQQRRLEEGLQCVRNDVAKMYSSLQIKKEFYGACLTEAAKVLEKVPTLPLPHQKLSRLCLAVDEIHNACRSAVSCTGTTGSPVEVCCEDLVGLLIATLAQCGGKLMVASYLEISVLLLEKSKESRYERGAFYATAMHSALTFAVSFAKTVGNPPSKHVVDAR